MAFLPPKSWGGGPMGMRELVCAVDNTTGGLDLRVEKAVWTYREKMKPWRLGGASYDATKVT